MATSLVVPFGAFALALYGSYSPIDDPELDAQEESPHAEAVRHVLLRPYEADDNSEDAVEWRTQIASLRILSAPDGKVSSRMGEDSMYLWLPDETAPGSLPFIALKEFLHLVDCQDLISLFSVSAYTLVSIGIAKFLIPAFYSQPLFLTALLIIEGIGFYYGQLKPDDIDDADDFAIALMQLHRDELEGAKRFLIQEKLEANSSYLGSALYWFTHPPLIGRIHKIDMALKRIPERFEPMRLAS